MGHRQAALQWMTGGARLAKPHLNKPHSDGAADQYQHIAGLVQEQCQSSLILPHSSLKVEIGDARLVFAGQQKKMLIISTCLLPNQFCVHKMYTSFAPPMQVASVIIIPTRTLPFRV